MRSVAEGYALRHYTQVGAFPQNTQGWGGDRSDLEPEIGFYDDSQPATLEAPESQFAAAAADYTVLTKQPNYLTTDDGRPMIFMCDSRGVGTPAGSGATAPVASQNRFLAMLRADVEADTGKDPYILVNIGRYVVSGSYRGYIQKQAEYFSTFDAIRPTMRCAMSGFASWSSPRRRNTARPGGCPAASSSTRTSEARTPSTSPAASKAKRSTAAATV